MSIEGLEHYTKEQLIEELINRQTFVGIVIFSRGDAKAGRMEAGETVITKSPPLTREGTLELLQLGQSLVPGMFSEVNAPEMASGTFAILADGPPLRLDEGGVVRVGKSRISLDLVVEQYENGMTPDEMVRAYDTLELADLYATIAYYLRHRDEVRAYLQRRTNEAGAMRAKIASERPRVTREELMARSGVPETDHAPAGQ